MKKFIPILLMIFLYASTSFAFLNDPNAIVKVVEKTKKGVVNISTTKTVKRQLNPMFEDDFFKRFFGDQFRGQGHPRQYKSKALGTGFIIDSKGYIITNNHVIEGADEIIIKLYDEKQFKAKVIGSDPLTDLALLKIEPKGEKLYPLKLGDSKATKVGEIVVAIGNPYGLESTVTAGIVSAKGRELGSSPYDNFMQTDASINPGNSGGPLVNLNGEVVGINTAIIASAQGLGFAVPVNMLKVILPQLKKGSVKRVWLGVTVQPIDEKLAKSFGLKNTEGALIADVIKGDPADKAGLKAGDIVIAIDDLPVKSQKDLIQIIGKMPPHKKVTLKVIRDGKEKKITVTLGQRKTGQIAQNNPINKDLPIAVDEVTAKEKTAYGIDAGVKVVNVKRDSNAYEAGIRRGNVIVWVNRKTIKNVDDFYKVYNSVKKGDVIAMKIVSRQGSKFVAFNKD
jgi:serine protease Do